MTDFPCITALTFVPLVGAAMISGLGVGKDRLAKGIALGSSLASLAFALGMALKFDGTSAALQFQQKAAWIPALSVDYFVGVDGLGLLMVLLTALLVPMAMLTAWRVTERTNLYFALVLMLQSGLFGAFTALNFFHWFLFYELSLVPAFFLIKLWGGPQRGPAATQFFIYTMVGSVALLLAFLAVWYATGTFDFIQLKTMAGQGGLTGALAAKLGWRGLTANQLGIVIFLGAFLGFAVKVPVFPFHTWLPAAYSEAPTSTTMLLTGAMSKMGMYGLLRILLPIFPEQVKALATPLLVLAVATVVLSAFAAFAQRDLKRMLAYSSINHLGYCLLGAFATMAVSGGDAALLQEKAAALNGVLLQMFNHGLTAATLFCFVSLLERRSGGLRGLDDFGGLRKVAPVFTGLMGISIFASLGLPGLNGFVGEFLIFKGVFPLAPGAAVVSALGLLLTAVFLLTLIQRVFAGPLNARWSKFEDLTTAERWLVLPATVLMFAIGLYPQLLIALFNQTVVQMVANLNR